MHADRIAFCPLVSHGEHADGQTDRRTDEHQTVTLCVKIGGLPNETQFTKNTT